MKFLSKLLILLLVFSCISEPDFHGFEATLTNESGVEFTAHFYYNEELVKTATLNNSESTSCNYSAEFFSSFRWCDGNAKIDTITIIFSDGRGYTCDLDPSPEQLLCFGDAKNPLLPSGFNNVGNRQYEFVITEEDFNNAHDLPE